MINLVRIQNTVADSVGRRIAKFFRLGRNVETAIQAAAYGTDANPIEDCIAVYAQTGIKGKTVIIGYINKNAIAAVGEHRIFSTDADGAPQFYIHLKNDGTCEIGGNTDNMVRFSELETAFNQLKDDHDALVTAFNTHMHPTAATGAPSPPTPVPNQIPAVVSTADISGAKIEEVKTL